MKCDKLPIDHIFEDYFLCSLTSRLSLLPNKTLKHILAFYTICKLCNYYKLSVQGAGNTAIRTNL